LAPLLLIPGLSKSKRKLSVFRFNLRKPFNWDSLGWRL
jgi:hypothetical protein